MAALNKAIISVKNSNELKKNFCTWPKTGPLWTVPLGPATRVLSVASMWVRVGVCKFILRVIMVW